MLYLCIENNVCFSFLKEVEAFNMMLGRLLNAGYISQARELAALFEHDSPDLTIVLVRVSDWEGLLHALCMYTYQYKFMCVYMYKYMYMCPHPYTCTCVYTHMRTFVYVSTYTCMCIHVYPHS